MIYVELFWAFFQIGAFSFGGGYAAMPLIQAQVIDKYHWMSMQSFTDLVTISQMTPGPIAINAATFVGNQVAGIPGAVIATIGDILPSCILVTILAFLYTRYRRLALLQEVLKTLDTFCSWALDRIGKETGCTPDTVHAVYSIVCSVISGIKEKLQVCDRAAIGLSRFVYLRMVLYNRTVIGSNYPEEPFSLFSNRRPESREYISAVKPDNLKIMKENDLDAWVATIDLDAQEADSSFLLTDLSRRIESRINQ